MPEGPVTQQEKEEIPYGKLSSPTTPIHKATQTPEQTPAKTRNKLNTSLTNPPQHCVFHTVASTTLCLQMNSSLSLGNH